MEVKMLCTTYFDSQKFLKGKVYTVADLIGSRWIAHGIAEQSEEPEMDAAAKAKAAAEAAKAKAAAAKAATGK